MDTTVADPQDETAALHRTLAERDTAIAERDAQLAASALEIERLWLQLARLRRMRFGRSSERLAADLAQLELRLEYLEEGQAEAEARRAPDPSGGRRPRRQPVRKPLPPHLPREVVVHEPEALCGCCPRERLARLGEDVTEVLEKVPARLKVIRHVRPRYACRTCERVFQAPAPDLPIERGRPGPGLIAHVAVSKYCDGLPLYRQSAILAREGVEIDRAPMADWLGHAAWWLAPVARLIGTHVMAQPVLWTDDTPTRVLAPGTGRTRQARFWVYAVDPRPYAGQGSPAALYRAEGRAPPRATHVACWAHVRRKLFEVFEATKSPVADEALRRIRELYAIEAEVNGQAAAERLAIRQAHSRPLLEAFHGWAEEQSRRVSAKAVLGKALQYALGRWEALTRHLEDGRLSIGKNLSERLLRGIAVSRKNFLFVGSDRGGERAALVYTLTESAKLNGLDPEAYIAAVLDRMARGRSNARLAELLPWKITMPAHAVGIG